MTTLANDCGCCDGITAIVPEPLSNRAGLSQIRYRVGIHGDFLASALAALSDPQFAAIRGLTTRETDDFTIALLDGWATLADVLTFYQERIANELWLRTATERDSILRLAELIGYRLKAGVAAETPLAFLLDETLGAPAAVTVQIGTKVQSVPGAEEKPQTFETIEEINARIEWNTLQPTLTTPPLIAAGLTSLNLKGTSTNLNPGDAILIVGDERDQHPSASPDQERWDLRVVLGVTADLKNNRTHVTWEKGLGKPPTAPASANVKIYAMRQRAALFGHNAPDPSLITKSNGNLFGSSWTNFALPSDHIDLDNAYSKIVAGSWISLTNSSGSVALCKALSVSFPSRADFAVSAKVTRIVLDTTEHFSLFGLRETLVHAQSEPLEITSGPLVTPAPDTLAAPLARDASLLAPLEGSVITLDRIISPLEAGRKIILSGKLLRVRVTAATLTLISTDGSRSRVIKQGETLVLLALPTVFTTLPSLESVQGLGGLFGSNLKNSQLLSLPRRAKWSLRTGDGFEGAVTTDLANLILTQAREDDAALSETAVVKQCGGDPSVLTLESPLAHAYDRATVTIAANVADSTHGETVTEVLGDGNGSQLNQNFELKQTPSLTYIRSTAPGGAESTLQVRVNDLLWHEAPTLFERSARERVFTTELADDGTVTVRFGDGIRGARLPSGSQNVSATYRRGIGLEGLVRAGQLSTLLTRPPGLQSAINPLAAEGADEPESLATAQENAPLTVMTLDRVVSLEDYENFSRAYGGIAKALATWTWDGRTRGVFVTVAGPLGAQVSTPLVGDLITAIHAAGDPFVPVRVEFYQEALFKVAGKIKVDPDYETEKVLTAASGALRDAFSFANRQFGQPVVLSEVIALVQAVTGVIAVDLDSLYRTGNSVKLNARLEADLPNGGDPASLGAAELLTLDPAPIYLGMMP